VVEVVVVVNHGEGDDDNDDYDSYFRRNQSRLKSRQVCLRMASLPKDCR
jgi:hypothetical protein